MTERRLAAIMFTDIVGYTALMGADEDKSFKVLKINRKIHKTLLVRFEGTLIKEMGDGILASFSSALNAVHCANEIQQEAKSENILLRIGIHVGEVVFEGGDMLGDGVNVASRLQVLAPEGSIYISGTVYKEIKNKAGIRVEFIEETTLKNIEEPVKIYKVIFEGNTDIEKKDEIKGSTKQTKQKIQLFVIAGFIILIAFFVLIWFRFFKTTSEKEEPGKERSVAVIPFRNESDEKGTEYFANGVMEAILNNLAKISELRVPGRTSVEQFRNHTETIPQIAKKLNVSFILEGSVQKNENTVRISLQLLDARKGNDQHIWSMQYDREYKNILQLQSELAQVVARELQVRITPEEKEIIEKIPTTNLTAYDLFLRARDAHMAYWLDNNNKQALENAITLYFRALHYDSTYAQAYTGLAIAYNDKNYIGTYLKDTFLDSSLVLADKALLFNNKLEEAYYVKGLYYNAKGDYNKSISEFNKSLEINPSYSWGYWQRGNVYALGINDYIGGLKDFYMAINLDHSPSLPLISSDIGDAYNYIGFHEKARFYYAEALALDNDSIKFKNYLSRLELDSGNFQASVVLSKGVLKKDSLNYIATDICMLSYLFLGKPKELYQSALKYLQLNKNIESFKINRMHRIAYAFWQAGNRNQAEHYFDEQVKYCEKIIKIGRWYSRDKWAYYDLACVYAFRGDKERAIQLLNEVNKREFFPLWWVVYFKHDPLLNNLRNDPRFKKIVSDVERKYETKHEEVMVWLKQEGMM